MEVIFSLFLQQFVGGDAAGEADRLGVGVFFEGFFEVFNKDVSGGIFERGGEVGDLLAS